MSDKATEVLAERIRVLEKALEWFKAYPEMVPNLDSIRYSERFEADMAEALGPRPRGRL